MYRKGEEETEALQRLEVKRSEEDPLQPKNPNEGRQ